MKRFILSSRPFMKNAPTAKSLVIPDERDFHAGSERLRHNISSALDRNTKGPWAHHTLFGPMTPEEWGWLQFKHIDHHFRQFGV